ncbi:lipoprotein [Candidatus Pelagibacter communis]|uniref:lipoprotein n=1 Tax=Pelagibacter ubique TaxID=198252 RepID=UPI0011781840|nr:lipoprotein [Candidatus Pelagibacter ubique]
MKKILILLSTIFLLTGCAESLALLGTGTSNGKILQSSLNSAVSFGVKKQTGKTPLEHVIAYAEEKNPGRKKETCVSSFEITRSEFCTIVKKQIKSKSTDMMEKTTEIAKEYPKKIIKEISKIEKIAKKSIIYNRR